MENRTPNNCTYKPHESSFYNKYNTTAAYYIEKNKKLKNRY